MKPGSLEDRVSIERHTLKELLRVHGPSADNERLLALFDEIQQALGRRGSARKAPARAKRTVSAPTRTVLTNKKKKARR